MKQCLPEQFEYKFNSAAPIVLRYGQARASETESVCSDFEAKIKRLAHLRGLIKPNGAGNLRRLEPRGQAAHRVECV